MTKKEQLEIMKDIKLMVKWLDEAVKQNASAEDIGQLAIQAAASCFQLEN